MMAESNKSSRGVKRKADPAENQSTGVKKKHEEQGTSEAAPTGLLNIQYLNLLSKSKTAL